MYHWTIFNYDIEDNHSNIIKNGDTFMAINSKYCFNKEN